MDLNIPRENIVSHRPRDVKTTGERTRGHGTPDAKPGASLDMRRGGEATEAGPWAPRPAPDEGVALLRHGPLWPLSVTASRRHLPTSDTSALAQSFLKHLGHQLASPWDQGWDPLPQTAGREQARYSLADAGVPLGEMGAFAVRRISGCL